MGWIMVCSLRQGIDGQRRLTGLQALFATPLFSYTPKHTAEFASSSTLDTVNPADRTCVTAE